MELLKELTPEDLFQAFRDSLEKGDNDISRAALEIFKKTENKGKFLTPTIEFINEEPNDKVINWGSNVLIIIGGDEAFQALQKLLDRTSHSDEDKKTYVFTRYYAVKALCLLSTNEKRQEILIDFATRISQDNNEGLLARAGALAILSRKKDKVAGDKLKNWLSNPKEFAITYHTLRALREIPLQDMEDPVLNILRTTDHFEHKREAISVLGNCRNSIAVVRALGDIIRTNPNSNLRLSAIRSLINISSKESVPDLLKGLTDKNAEVRVRAATAIKAILSKEDAISRVIEEALNKETIDALIGYFVEALRIIDLERKDCVNILSKEINQEDRGRSQCAEQILIELGGWAAIQKLNQRQNTLNALDRLLKESEDIVKKTFEDTIRQAKINFYFALCVNILIVFIGISLIVISIWQVSVDPTNFEKWVLAGAAGVFGLIINMYFNNPRKNAREDLTCLMDVNIIFLSFLRQLNEIDATFKHAYLESKSFGTSEMSETVGKIQSTMHHSLRMAAGYLGNSVNLNETGQSLTETASLSDNVIPIEA